MGRRVSMSLKISSEVMPMLKTDFDILIWYASCTMHWVSECRSDHRAPPMEYLASRDRVLIDPA